MKGRRVGSVGSGAFRLDADDEWDWTAIVLRDAAGQTRCWMLPRKVAFSRMTRGRAA